MQASDVYLLSPPSEFNRRLVTLRYYDKMLSWLMIPSTLLKLETSDNTSIFNPIYRV